MAGAFLNVEHGVQNILSRLFEDLANQLVLEVVDKIEEEEEVVDKIYHSIHLSYVVCILKVWPFHCLWYRYLLNQFVLRWNLSLFSLDIRIIWFQTFESYWQMSKSHQSRQYTVISYIYKKLVLWPATDEISRNCLDSSHRPLVTRDYCERNKIFWKL